MHKYLHTMCSSTPPSPSMHPMRTVCRRASRQKRCHPPRRAKSERGHLSTSSTAPPVWSANQEPEILPCDVSSLGMLPLAANRSLDQTRCLASNPHPLSGSHPPDACWHRNEQPGNQDLGSGLFLELALNQTEQT